MALKADPVHKVGDLVVSFRGDKAKITRVILETAPHRSHKVEVEWEDQDNSKAFTGPYYEGVFSARTE